MKIVNNEINPIDIFKISITPFLFDSAVFGLLRGKAYLRNIIVDGYIGLVINFLELLIAIYFIYKFYVVYVQIFKLKNIVIICIKIIINPFFILLIILILFNIYDYYYYEFKILYYFIIKILLYIGIYIFLIKEIIKVLKELVKE